MFYITILLFEEAVMSDDLRANMGELLGTLGETWKGILLSAGLTSGIFEQLDEKRALSVDELVNKLKFDRVKLENWFYYMEGAGIVKREQGGYLLTPKGLLFSPHSPVKDLMGLVHLTEYYMEAGLKASKTFKSGTSLEKLSEGKVSRNYQPKVSDNFSHALVEHLKEVHVGEGDSLLDIGCGNGSFLRTLLKLLPGVTFTGVDSNLFAIEKGKKANLELQVEGRIELLVGDITSDMGDFEDQSYDWLTAINIFHFIPPGKRDYIIDNMMRIARKGVFFTEVEIEKSPLSYSANSLMFLLWEDFTGFFRSTECEELNKRVEREHKGYTMRQYDIMKGNSNLIVLLRD